MGAGVHGLLKPPVSKVSTTPDDLISLHFHSLSASEGGIKVYVNLMPIAQRNEKGKPNLASNFS